MHKDVTGIDQFGEKNTITTTGSDVNHGKPWHSEKVFQF
jgi:hypothetical protein